MDLSQLKGLDCISVITHQHSYMVLFLRTTFFSLQENNLLSFLLGIFSYIYHTQYQISHAVLESNLAYILVYVNPKFAAYSPLEFSYEILSPCRKQIRFNSSFATYSCILFTWNNPLFVCDLHSKPEHPGFFGYSKPKKNSSAPENIYLISALLSQSLRQPQLRIQ